MTSRRVNGGMRTWVAAMTVIAGLCASIPWTATAEGDPPSVDEVWREQWKLAQELEDVLASALEAAKHAPPQETALQQRLRDASLAEWKQAHSMAQEYRSRIHDEMLLDENRPFFESLRASVSAARQTAGDAVPDAEVNQKLVRIDELIDQLARVYEREG